MSALNRPGGQAGFRHRFEEGQQEGRGVGEPCDGTGAVRPVPFSSRLSSRLQCHLHKLHADTTMRSSLFSPETEAKHDWQGGGKSAFGT